MLHPILLTRNNGVYLSSKEFKERYIDSSVLELDVDLDGSVLSLPANLLLLSTKLSAPATVTSAPVADTSAPVEKVNDSIRTFSNLTSDEIELLSRVVEEIESLPKRIDDKDVINRLIIRLCSIDSFKLRELSIIFGRSDKYLLREYISQLLKSGKLSYLYPDMLNHPSQGYKSAVKSN